MEAMYFIGTIPQANGLHFIHTEDCPFLPSPGRRTFLGSFSSPEKALEEGKRHFATACGCLFCLKEKYKQVISHVNENHSELPVFLKTIPVMVSPGNAYICGVN
jgi:hypothetical protein